MLYQHLVPRFHGPCGLRHKKHRSGLSTIRIQIQIQHRNPTLLNKTAIMVEDELEVIEHKLHWTCSLTALQTRLRSHSKAFEGLMSLIPANLYYEKDTSVSYIPRLPFQWPCLQQGGWVEEEETDFGRETGIKASKTQPHQSQNCFGRHEGERTEAKAGTWSGRW